MVDFYNMTTGFLGVSFSQVVVKNVIHSIADYI